MEPKAFERALGELKSLYRQADENPASFQVKACRHCGSCMFCEGCDSCYRCNYCTGCTTCSNCTHCERCANCHSSAYCVECHNCIGSKYLEMCEHCADCNYCFGCVGLSKKDFHILNEPYGRAEYFEIVKKLQKAMRR